MMANEGQPSLMRIALSERLEAAASKNRDDMLWSFARLVRVTSFSLESLTADAMEQMSARWFECQKERVRLAQFMLDPPVLIIDGARQELNPGAFVSIGRFSADSENPIQVRPKNPRKLTWKERLTGWTRG